MTLLIFCWVIGSLAIGFLLGRAIRICEEKECANSKTNTPQYAPGAEWGTWSPTTQHPIWRGPGHAPDGEQW